MLIDAAQSLTKDTMLEMKWTDIRSQADRNAVVLIPIGVVEEHGPHLPLVTDVLISRMQCLQVRDRLRENGIEAVLAPPFFWGVCQATGSFIGSFPIRKETATALMRDILVSLAGFGFRTVFGITGHNDIEHNIAMLDAFRDAGSTLGMRAAYLFNESVMHHYGLDGSEPHVCPYRPQSIRVSTAPQPDVHAGDLETALVEVGYPGLADLDIANALPPTALGDDRIMSWLFGGQTEELSSQGYLGAPAMHADVDVEAYLKDVASRLTEAILAKGWCGAIK